MAATSRSDKELRWIRSIMLFCFFTAAFLTAFVISTDNSVRAPLLTLIGTASLILVLFPAGPTITNISAIVGTAIVMSGSGAWFLDATQGESFLEYLLFQTTVAGIVVYVVVSLILSIRGNRRTKPAPSKSKSADGKKFLVVFVTLALAIAIRAILNREKRYDTTSQNLLE